MNPVLFEQSTGTASLLLIVLALLLSGSAAFNALMVFFGKKSLTHLIWAFVLLGFGLGCFWAA